MMTRPSVVVLLGLALLCGLVAGQDQVPSEVDSAKADAAEPASPKKMNATTSTTTESEGEASAEPEPEPKAEPEPEPSADDTATNAKSDRKNKKGSSDSEDSEASFSNEDNGAALLSTPLPSLVLAAVLAKVLAH